MTFETMLINTAKIYTRSEKIVEGRVEYEWVSQGTYPCRFASPVPGRLNTGGTYAEAQTQKFNAVIFIGPDVLPLLLQLPVRFSTADAGWANWYELQAEPRVYYDRTSVHHLELDVVRCDP